jgi:pilus assembly protein CpaE
VEEIKVLICNRNEQARDNLKRAIQFDQVLHVVGFANSGEDTLQVVQDLSPEVLLVDLDMGDMDGVDVARQLLDNDPLLQIILHAHEFDYGLMRKAMKFGISDVIKSPIDPDELHAKIRAAAERKSKILEKFTGPLINSEKIPEEPTKPEGTLLAVYSAKGGAGCTFVATNMAILLHSHETPTVLVDGDLQFGDVPIFLNQQVNVTMSDLLPHEDELDGEMVREALLACENGLKVLAAPLSPELADNMTGEAFGKILEQLLRQFDYVVVDTGSELNDVTVAVLDKAALILTIATPDISSIKNTRSFIDVLGALEIPLDHVLLVLNGLERGDSINGQKIAENLHVDVAAELPFDRATVLKSINRGEPLLANDSAKPIAKEMLKILAEVKEKLADEEEEVE